MDTKSEKTYIYCECCQNTFYDEKPISKTQINDCASDIIFENGKRYIFSHYGSRFDTLKFNFLPHSLFDSNNGSICDNCIEHLLDNKEIETDDDFTYFK